MRARTRGGGTSFVTAHGSPQARESGPQRPEAIPGIAALFNTTEDQVARMIAADWYGVQSGNAVPAQAEKICGRPGHS